MHSPETGEARRCDNTPGLDSKTPSDEGPNRPDCVIPGFAQQVHDARFNAVHPQVAALLFDLADDAANADTLAAYFDSVSDDPHAAECLICTLRDTLRRIGWQADLALHRMGAMKRRSEDPADWILSPRTRQLGGH